MAKNNKKRSKVKKKNRKMREAKEMNEQKIKAMAKEKK